MIDYDLLINGNGDVICTLPEQTVYINKFNKKKYTNDKTKNKIYYTKNSLDKYNVADLSLDKIKINRTITDTQILIESIEFHFKSNTIQDDIVYKSKKQAFYDNVITSKCSSTLQEFMDTIIFELYTNQRVLDIALTYATEKENPMTN